MATKLDSVRSGYKIKLWDITFESIVERFALARSPIQALELINLSYEFLGNGCQFRFCSIEAHGGVTQVYIQGGVKALLGLYGGTIKF